MDLNELVNDGRDRVPAEFGASLNDQERGHVDFDFGIEVGNHECENLRDEGYGRLGWIERRSPGWSWFGVHCGRCLTLKLENGGEDVWLV